MKTVSCTSEKLAYGGDGLFILGNAINVTERLKRDYLGKLDLIYLDPPFGSGESYAFSVKGSADKIKIPAYSDGMDEKSYMELMRSVLQSSYELLSDHGSLYLHIDQRMSAKLKLLLDEIFGAKNCMNEIIWAYNSGGRSTKHFSRKHDNILFYRKSVFVYFNIAATGVPRGDKKRNNMRRNIDENGRVFFSIRSNGKTYTYHEDSLIYPSDVWNDIEHLHQRDPERTGFYTQKPEALLRRIISASCPEGGTVADFFSGSGTTAAVASKLGRKFIAADISPLAMLLLKKRQLRSVGNLSLFDEAKSFTIEYPLCSRAVKASFDVNKSTGGSSEAILRSYSGDTLPSYMASGVIKGNTFYPYSYILDPIKGTSVALPEADNAVLQICDHSGAQRFYALD